MIMELVRGEVGNKQVVVEIGWGRREGDWGNYTHK